MNQVAIKAAESDEDIQRKSIIEVILDKKHPQQALLTPSRFCSLAQERGISIKESDLETWDKLGLLHPVMKVRNTYTFHRITERRETGEIVYDPQPLEQVAENDENVIKVYKGWTFAPEQLKFWKEHQSELVIVPSIQTFQPWDELREEYVETVTLLYHPYQIFRAAQRYIVKSMCKAIRPASYVA